MCPRSVEAIKEMIEKATDPDKEIGFQQSVLCKLMGTWIALIRQNSNVRPHDGGVELDDYVASSVDWVAAYAERERQFAAEDDRLAV